MDENTGSLRFNDCINSLKPSCDQRVKEIFLIPAVENGNVPYLNPNDFEKAEKICLECENFEEK